MANSDPNKEVNHFGVWFSPLYKMIHVHMWFIQKGGQFKMRNGEIAGLGNFEHYKRLIAIIWPEIDQHRWFDLILKEWSENILISLMGPKDASKTLMMSVIGLTDYYCFPSNTLGIFTSTSKAGLELRIWGEVKSLHIRAKQRFDFLPGHPVDSLRVITTDNLKAETVRDLRRGLVCVGGDKIGEVVGLKQKRRRLYADEFQHCFPKGTLVDTPKGPRAIETIKIGDSVINALGTARVASTISHIAKNIITVHTKDGREIICTPEHPIFTQNGWINAIYLSDKHYIISAHEAVQILRSENPNENAFWPFKQFGNILQSVLFSEMEVGTTGLFRKTSHTGKQSKKVESQIQTSPRASRDSRSSTAENAHGQSNGESGHETKTISHIEGDWTQAKGSRRKWFRTNEGGNSAIEIASRKPLQLSSSNRKEIRQWLSYLLQSGCFNSSFKTWDRSRWQLSQQSEPSCQGSEKGRIIKGAWVDRVEISKPYDFRETGLRRGTCRVYNLEVEEHPSYSVNGFLVHNCKPAFLTDGLPNLNSGDFKGIFSGNPIGDGDCLDKLAEPKDGWGSISEPETTTVWDTRDIGGRCINLIGTNSPNFDFPQDPAPRFPYMIHQKSIDRISARWGENSFQFYRYAKGTRIAGMDAKKVITRDMCIEHHAMEKAFWVNETRTSVYAVDAAYGNIGGDRCVGGSIEYGRDVTGHSILSVNRPVIIPVKPHKIAGRSPEDQIALYVRDECERDGIPPRNVFYDATGRGSLGTAFSRLWSADVNPIEFGGAPTERPVNSELMIRDLKDGHMRLMTARERFSKLVTELWWSVRYVIEANQMRNLPEDVMLELSRRIWRTVRGDKYEVETKDEMKERVDESPDLADWLCISIEGARRLGFQIADMELKDQLHNSDQWKKDLKEKAAKLQGAGQLTYR